MWCVGKHKKTAYNKFLYNLSKLEQKLHNSKSIYVQEVRDWRESKGAPERICTFNEILVVTGNLIGTPIKPNPDYFHIEEYFKA